MHHLDIREAARPRHRAAAAALAAITLTLAGCAGDADPPVSRAPQAETRVPDTGVTSRRNQFFVQGGACVTRNRRGQLVRVGRNNCPSLRAGPAATATE